tara:strand:- start:6792 stop:7568 length:777 start_codon:yes stop_codon:yes gene_type:complete
MIKEKFNLSGKVAVITGASKGIGKAIARGFAEFGAHVVVSSRDKDAVKKVENEFKSEGLSASSLKCHVGNIEDRNNLINSTLKSYDRIDILVNNAGTNPYFGPIHKMPQEAYQKTMDVNLNSAIELSNLVYPTMKNQNSGNIIHISSIEGIHPSKFMSAYNISKAALIMLTKNQSIEWGKYNIRVNAICPGYVRTKLSSGLLEFEGAEERLVNNVSLKRASDPEEMAGLAVFLASDASSYITGTSIVNDGGLLNSPIF